MLHKNSKQPFYLGDWCVIPEQCQLQNSHDTKHLQPKLMEVLLYLCENLQHVQSTDDLIQACWSGQPMTDNPIHKTIAQLRKALGDSSDVPKYIKTIPRKGYMMIAKVSRGVEKRSQQTPFWRDQSPFLGLQSFQQHHKDIFFGRSQPTTDFLKFIERINQTDTLLIFLSGASGCGKSSFIHAGIVPKLLNPYKPFKLKFTDSLIWQAGQNNCAVDLIATLHSNSLFTENMCLEKLIEIWQQNPTELVDFMRSVDESNKRTVLFIDQVEKALLNEGGQVTALFQLIHQLNLSKRFLIIVCARDEAISAIKQSKAYKPLVAQTLDFRLPQMQSKQQIEWVEATTQAAGLFFEVNPNRQETLFDLLKNSIERYKSSLSAIQIIMFRLYECRDNSTLQYASFHDLGGFEGILNNYMEEVFLSQPLSQQNALIKMFPKLVQYESFVEQKPINRSVALAMVTGDLNLNQLSRLIDQRLLQSAQNNDLDSIKFNEPHMARHWRRLADWIVEHQNSLVKSSEINFLTLRWLRNGQQKSCLINQQQLAQMSELEQQGLLVLSKEQQQYFQVSNAAVKQRNKTHVVIKVAAAVLLIISSWMTIDWQHEKDKHRQTQANLQSLSQHLTDELNPQLKAKGQLSLLEALNLELLKLFENKPPQQFTEIELHSYSAALNQLGELSYNQRKYDQARNYFDSSVAGIGSRSILNNRLLAELMLSQYWLGYLAFIENQYGQARSHWNDYLQTALQLCGLEPENTQWQLEQSYALNNLGSLSESTGELKAAASYFDQSIAIKTELLKTQADDMTLQADLADSLSWQGNIYRKQGFLKQALAAYQNSANLTKKLKPDQHGNNTKLHRESLAIHRMASVTFDLGKVPEALGLAQSALEKSLLLNQLEPQDNNYKKELISLHLLNATIYRQLSNFDQSLSHIQKANQLIDYFKLNLKMTAQITGYLMMVKREQAIIFNHFGQTDSAITAINEGLSLWEAEALNKQNLARITFVMLNLDWVQIMKNKPVKQSQYITEEIDIHLDQAWREINPLMEKLPGDAQIMAIALSLLAEKSVAIVDHKYIPLLQKSEYRNPEYYQPLIRDQLIKLN
jgi:DNA-binding winged helix-turn-helix (wHTH) protein/tetratricopeptide (TPR) repeat protein